MLVHNAVNAIGGKNPTIFCHKKLTRSDCMGRQNRFLFSSENVRNFILTQLSEEGKEKSHLPLGLNLNDDPNLRNLGLPVDLYMSNGLAKFQTFLIRRASKVVVLKGEDWKRVLETGNLKPGDDILLWSFRWVENDTLFLVIQKME